MPLSLEVKERLLEIKRLQDENKKSLNENITMNGWSMLWLMKKVI